MFSMDEEEEDLLLLCASQEFEQAYLSNSLVVSPSTVPSSTTMNVSAMTKMEVDELLIQAS